MYKQYVLDIVSIYNHSMVSVTLVHTYIRMYVLYVSYKLTTTITIRSEKD